MRLARVAAIAALLLSSIPAAAGGFTLIDESKLPDTPAVRGAWAAAVAQRSYADEWAPEWKHDVPREEVAKALGWSLAALRDAAAKDASLELLLAIGVTARWAHNVDVKEAPQAGIEALTRAAALPGAGYRPEWYLGANLCTMSGADGMPHLLEARRLAGAAVLPLPYWDDLLLCSAISNMPAHAVWAGRELEKVGALGQQESRLLEAQRKLLLEPGPDAPAKEAWEARGPEASRRVVNRALGFEAPLMSEPSATPIKDGTAVISGPIGEYPGKTGPVAPFVLVQAHVAKPGEDLRSFVRRFSPKEGVGSPAPALPCPAAACATVTADLPDAYAPEGGGLVLIQAFERQEPPDRGVALERPVKPATKGDGQVQFFRPEPRPIRFKGTIYYLVVLDTARSVERQARAAFDEYLKGIVVE